MLDLTDQAIAVLLVSLRIAPTLAFAYPFTLVRVPAIVRVMLGIGFAAWLVAGHPAQSWQADYRAHGLVLTMLGELFLGIALSLSLQLAFAALLTAGRAIDIQAGFGLAVLVDPATQSQLPLVGTLFAYAAGAIFFATGGPAERTFATLVGLELRPRRLRDAAALWQALEQRRGIDGREAIWAHPDLLPSAADLDDPAAWAERGPDDTLDISELEGPND